MAWQWWDDFDKKMCGIWVSEGFHVAKSLIKAYINIEQTQDGVTVRYDYGGCIFSQKAFYVEHSDNELYFFHNDKSHRAEYTLSLAGDDLLECKFTIIDCWGHDGKFEKDIEFTRLVH